MGGGGGVGARRAATMRPLSQRQYTAKSTEMATTAGRKLAEREGVGKWVLEGNFALKCSSSER